MGWGENRIRGLLASTRAGGSYARLRSCGDVSPCGCECTFGCIEVVCVSAISYSTVLSDACYPLARREG